MKNRRIDPGLIAIYICLGIAGLYLVAQLGYAYDLSFTGDTPPDLISVFNLFESNLTKPGLIKENLLGLRTETYTFKFVMIGFFVGILWVLYWLTTRKKYRKGEEHGSARWATKKEAAKLADKKDASNNIILTNDVQMSLNTRQTRKNLNVLIIGGSGAGKTRFYVKPNIMQMNTSYIVTDPKGELLRSTGKMLENNGYTVKVFNLINMKNSFNYNPFAYLQDANGKYNDANVIKLINVLMKNTKKEGQSSGDQFWDDSTEALLLALAFFIVYEGNENEKNFATVMELLQLAEVKEEEEDYKSPLDFIFEDLEAQDKYHPAVKYYKIFKKAAGKTAKSILISAGVRLKAFLNDDVINLTHKDTINITEIGEKKTALFVVIPDSDDTFNFLVAMLYTQIFDVLYGLADFKYGGRLPVHVRFMLDEFANIGTIPRFDKLIATMRSREISVNTIIQNMAQLKTLYKDSWESIVGNCDSLLFLGGKEQTSLEYISKALGKETIDTLNRNRSKSYRNSSTTQNEGILGRELMTADEVGAMPDSDCILLVRGLRPFYSKKFVIEKHKNYCFIEDSNKSNAYDINSLVTEIMPRNETDTDITGYENVEIDDVNEEEIREILESIGEGEEEVMTSTVDIPDDSLQEDDNVVLVEHGEGLKEDGTLSEVINSPVGDPADDEIVINDLTVEEGDVFSDLNFGDLSINADDEYIVDEA